MWLVIKIEFSYRGLVILQKRIEESDVALLVLKSIQPSETDSFMK